MQLLSPEPKLVAAAQPGACILPASLSALAPALTYPHLQSTELHGATHQAPSPAHTHTPLSPLPLSTLCFQEAPQPPATARAVGGEGEKGLLPVSEPESRPPSTVVCFVHCIRLLVSGVGRR